MHLHVLEIFEPLLLLLCQKLFGIYRFHHDTSPVAARTEIPSVYAMLTCRVRPNPFRFFMRAQRVFGLFASSETRPAFLSISGRLSSYPDPSVQAASASSESVHVRKKTLLGCICCGRFRSCIPPSPRLSRRGSRLLSPRSALRSRSLGNIGHGQRLSPVASACSRRLSTLRRMGHSRAYFL